MLNIFKIVKMKNFKNLTRMELHELNEYISKGVILSTSNCEKSINIHIKEVMFWLGQKDKKKWWDYYYFTVGPIPLDGTIYLGEHSTLLEYRVAKLNTAIAMLQTIYDNEKKRREHIFKVLFAIFEIITKNALIPIMITRYFT